jgi:ribonucleoside-diphosphate reductase alpha chain
MLRSINLLFIIMEALKHIELSENAAKLLAQRYVLHHANRLENAEELFDRVAKTVSSAELKWGSKSDALKMETAFFDMMSELLFLPNPPALMNAGTAVNQLSACFALPVEDSITGIYTSLKNAALIHQTGGGTGFNFSQLRPKNDRVSFAGGAASGPVSFMKVFDAATEPIKYGGKKTGANLGILNIDHPDIEDFIVLKKNGHTLENFTIAVAVTDDFMDAVEWNSSWNLFNPTTKTVTQRVQARDLWQLIIENAWESGDPQLIFTDTINNANPLAETGKIDSANPCVEVPLYANESCPLGSINIAKFVKKDRSINWKWLGIVIHNAVRFLDDLIEVNNFIVPEVTALVNQNRKIGLGIMGWADLLMLKEIPYDSNTAIQLAENVMEFIQQKAIEASEELVKKRGCFPSWEKSTYFSHQPLRNASLLCIAETASVAMIADASTSIEPLSSLAYERKPFPDTEGENELNKYVLNYLEEHDMHNEKLINKIKWHGNLAYISLPSGMKSIFKTAAEISPEWHLKYQVAFQKYVDNAVTKIICMPESSTVEDVGRIYKMAWQMKAKEVRIARTSGNEE